MHIHIYCTDGEAKFWIEPKIELAINYGLDNFQINEIKKIIEERQNEIRHAWKIHFKD